MMNEEVSRADREISGGFHMIEILMEELNNAAQEGKTPEETASHIQVEVQEYLDGLK